MNEETTKKKKKTFLQELRSADMVLIYLRAKTLVVRVEILKKEAKKLRPYLKDGELSYSMHEIKNMNLSYMIIERNHHE